MNYTSKDEGSDEDIEIDDYEAWAREYARSLQSDDGNNSGTSTHMKKLGSSAITNILPRMERLNGPYGMYATVYGVSTKVLHVAHPVPARAILTGSGVVDVGGMNNGIGECFERQNSSFLGEISQSVTRPFKRLSSGMEGAAIIPSEERKQRRRYSALRLLTGSTKYPAYDHFKNFSGDGVFTADGSDWKAKRASVLHCLLRSGGTDGMLEKEINRAADSFEREVTWAKQTMNKEGDDKDGPVMNVVTMLQRSTIGLIYRIITHHNVEFSPDIDTNEQFICSPKSSAASLTSLDKNQHNVAKASEDDNHTNPDVKKDSQMKLLLPIYLDAVTKIRMIVLAQSRSIWYLLPRWAYRTFSPMYRDEERTMVPIRQFARLACENAVKGSPLELLSQRSSHASKEGEATSAVSKDLLDEAITLLFAGQDTSAATLSWTLHLLSLHPQEQQKVVEEVRSVLSSLDEGEMVSKNTISQLPYLDAVIKESMRLYPVAPFIVRKLTTDVTIPIESQSVEDDATTTSKQATSIPESTFACIWIYALQRNPKLWTKPDEFIPERWIDPDLRSNDLGQQEVGSYMPFALGPRNCLGQPIAQVILRVLLARILNKYEVRDPKFDALQRLGEETGEAFDTKYLLKDMQAGFTVLPSNGLRIKLVERC